ncbi:MAG TPA: hypothetical protein VIU12_17450 [Chryseolinea sp.]
MYKVYISIVLKEKVALEKELLAKIPRKKRKALSKALMDFFYRPAEGNSNISHPMKGDEMIREEAANKPGGQSVHRIQ